LTSDEVNAIVNAEIKRIAVDRMGAERFLTQMKAVVIDEAINDVEGTKEALLESGNIVYFCGVCRSTGRVYYIPVDPEVRTCDAARKFMSSGKDLLKCIGAS